MYIDRVSRTVKLSLVQFLGAILARVRSINWKSKKKNCISLSIAEVEYVVVVVNCSNIVWFKQLLASMKVEINDLAVIFCDNTNVINISKNLVMHNKTK